MLFDSNTFVLGSFDVWSYLNNIILLPCQAQEVVLLDDDDDVQPIESIEEDTYEKGWDLFIFACLVTMYFMPFLLHYSQSNSQDAAVDLTELACTSGREFKIYYPSRWSSSRLMLIFWWLNFYFTLIYPPLFLTGMIQKPLNLLIRI